MIMCHKITLLKVSLRYRKLVAEVRFAVYKKLLKLYSPNFNKLVRVTYYSIINDLDPGYEVYLRKYFLI